MTPEAQRIAIAEACGWTIDPAFRLCSLPPSHPRHAAAGLFDPLDDLNAMHAAEMTLNRKRCLEYVTELGYVVGNTGVEYYDLIRATAAQRAEAFLRTLNLWTDERPSHREVP